ncbi:c-type cytochrome [Winogradskyella vidalii]|uniref:c-type cytochrome n=1 Tax=Winogradskyella vidalii TaxID=2615024 RepID=UPI0015CDD89D|nr:cytochrome c [Winogradskyella vidalii]
MKKIVLLSIVVTVLVSCQSNTKQKELAANYQKVTEQDQPKLEASIKRGESIYNDMCITCHLADGKGVPKAFPPLADSDFLRENQTKSIKAVKHGLSGEIVVNGITYNSTMAPLGLLDDEVADVMNYINNSWGNEIDNFITPEKVSKL